MENVTGLLSTRTENEELVIDIIISEFEKLGYKANYMVLNAANYGIPQMRKRVLVFGSKEGVINIPTELNNKNNYLTLEDAISNLPSLDSDNLGEHSIETVLKSSNPYQDYLQKHTNGILYNHINKKLRMN